MTENTPTPPFDAIVANYATRSGEPRPSRVVRIVRETQTLWVEEGGTKWRKKDRRELGTNSSFIYDFRLVVPDFPEYSQEYVDEYWQRRRLARFLGMVNRIAAQESVADMAPLIRDLGAMLDEWEDQK